MLRHRVKTTQNFWWQVILKPWKVSDERTERTNPANGLCLNALHDKAFDRG